MTQRTHDLAAVTLVSYRFLAFPIESLTWETILGIGVGTLLGSLIPDIDNVSSKAWKHKLFPWEGKGTRDVLLGHRHLSHSLAGIILFSFVFYLLLSIISLPHLNNIYIVQAFFVAQLSHLIADSLTIQGVPWLYPVPFKFGFPPLAFLRIKTGGWLEKSVVFPLLLFLLIWIFYAYQGNIPTLDTSL